MRRLADDGAAVVLISSDLAEIQEHADRVVVFRQGHVAGECSAGASSEEIAALALPKQTEQPAGRAQLAKAGRRAGTRASEGALLIAIGLLVALLAATTDTFLSADNLSRVLASTSVWCLLALAAGGVILAGGIDISIGALLALSAGVGGLVMQRCASPSLGVTLGVLAALATGLTGGLLNAGLALLGRVHPIVITLGTMTIFRGLLIAMTAGETIDELPGEYSRMGPTPAGSG